MTEVEKKRRTDERWGVEVTVTGFGPDHQLWPRFAEQAMAHEERTLQWVLYHTSDQRGDKQRIRAITYADSAESAIKRVMRVIGVVGRSVDRYGQVAWTDMEGVAFRL